METQVEAQDKSAQNSEEKVDELKKFIAIGYNEKNKLLMYTSDGDGAAITIGDLLLFQRYLDDKISSMTSSDTASVLSAIKQTNDAIAKLLGKVDMLELQINNLKG